MSGGKTQGNSIHDCPPCHQSDRLGLVLSEEFPPRPGRVAAPPDGRQHEISDRRQNPRRRAGSDPAMVLAEGYVAHMEQPILDIPVIARQTQQVFRRGPFDGNRGNRMDNLARTERGGFACALDPTDRGQARPDRVQSRWQPRADRDAPCFDPSVSLVDCFATTQIGRVRQRTALYRLASDDRGGKCRRRRGPVPLSVPVGCLSPPGSTRRQPHEPLRSAIDA